MDKLAAVAGEAVSEALREVPLYKDAVQPSARELGVQLSRFVRFILAPARGVMWLEEQAERAIVDGLSARIHRIPHERLVAPRAIVLGPTVEALKYAAHEPDLRELYLNLLGTAMDAETTANALPAYVEIIRQLTPDEVKLLEQFRVRNNHPMADIRGNRKNGSGGITLYRNLSLLPQAADCVCPELGPLYIGNLHRLGLVAIHDGYRLLERDADYQAIRQSELGRRAVQEIESMGRAVEFIESSVEKTQLGAHFLTACTRVPP